jgi:hypothetical protein
MQLEGHADEDVYHFNNDFCWHGNKSLSLCLYLSPASRIDGEVIEFLRSTSQNLEDTRPRTAWRLAKYTYEVLWTPETRFTRQVSAATCLACQNGASRRLGSGVNSEVPKCKRTLVIAFEVPEDPGPLRRTEMPFLSPWGRQPRG